jgi:hypothetical protein
MQLFKSSIILLLLSTIFFACSSKRDLKFILVRQNVSLYGFLKEYYILKNYKSDSLDKKKIDSLALILGRSKGREFESYSVNFFKSSYALRRDVIFFKNSDSITMAKKRTNMFNYRFYKGGFREKQTIVDGKILPPLYDSVVIKFDSLPSIRFEN